MPTTHSEPSFLESNATLWSFEHVLPGHTVSLVAGCGGAAEGTRTRALAAAAARPSSLLWTRRGEASLWYSVYTSASREPEVTSSTSCGGRIISARCVPRWDVTEEMSINGVADDVVSNR